MSMRVALWPSLRFNFLCRYIALGFRGKQSAKLVQYDAVNSGRARFRLLRLLELGFGLRTLF